MTRPLLAFAISCAVFAACFAGCSVDTLDRQELMEPEIDETTAQQLCENPDEFDGRRVTIPDPDLEAWTTSASRGIWHNFVIECSGDYSDGIELVAADDAPFEPVSIEFDARNADSDGDIDAPREHCTPLGCVGPLEDELCTPAPHDEIDQIEGVFRTDVDDDRDEISDDECLVEHTHLQMRLEVDDADY